jgi:hypothetical protein
MSQEKYIGMDVHQATISVAVMDAQGKLIMECLLETKAATIVEFIGGLHGTLSLTFEEGTSDVSRPFHSSCGTRNGSSLAFRSIVQMPDRSTSVQMYTDSCPQNPYSSQIWVANHFSGIESASSSSL